MVLTVPQSEGNITNWVHPSDKTGEFRRDQSQLRNFIKKGGEFPPEAGRYHLYVSYACPWAHRTLIVRQLKGLQSIIPFTSVHWHMPQKGWRFATSEDKDAPGDEVTPDPVKGHESYTHLRDIYFQVDSQYKGRFTVPTLYDVKQGKIVSNESSEIIRMFYTEVSFRSSYLNSLYCVKDMKLMDDSLMISSQRNTRTSFSFRRICRRRLKPQMTGYTQTSIMASTAQASPPQKKHTLKL